MEAMLQAAGLAGCTPHRLGNSYVNGVYRVDDPPAILRVLSRPRKWQQELGAYQAVAGRGLPVPRVLAAGQGAEGSWMLLELLPGVNLDEVIHQAPPALFYEAGALLARLHQVRTERYGLFSPDGLVEPYDDWAPAYRPKVEQYLAHPATQAELTAAEQAAIWRYWERRAWALVGGHPSVTHRDYRPGNLLVDPERWTITGLFDFEAAQAAEPGVDFGKVESEFFGQRPDARGPFEAGYQSVRPLPSRAEVELYDLVNVLGGIPWASDWGDRAFFAQNARRLRELLEVDQL